MHSACYRESRVTNGFGHSGLIRRTSYHGLILSQINLGAGYTRRRLEGFFNSHFTVHATHAFNLNDSLAHLFSPPLLSYILDGGGKRGQRKPAQSISFLP
jgi:hypothetical protein